MHIPLPDTAAYRLFHHRYQVKIPRALMYSKEYVRKVGYSVSGDPRVDQTTATDLQTVNQTGAGIAMLYAQGAPLCFLDERDTIKLYADIQQHLTDWETQARLGIHPDAAPPLDDMRMFEAVAMDIYSTAKFYEPEEKRGDELRDLIMMMNRRRNPVGTERFLRDKITGEGGELKPYVSIVDRIEEYLLGD